MEVLKASSREKVLGRCIFTAAKYIKIPTGTAGDIDNKKG
jgi:hypothetical protein